MPGRPLTLPSPLEGERGFGGAAWRRIASALAWRPEWPVTVLVAVSWLLLALLSLQGDAASHAAHTSSAAPATSAAVAASALATSRFAAFTSSTFASWANSLWTNAPLWLMSWLLMSFAMMVPATLPAVRHVALNSIDARRARAMTVYVSAYVAVWGLFGLIAFALIEASRMLLSLLMPALPLTWWPLSPLLEAASSGHAQVATTTTDRALLVILLAIATGWQLTRIKRRAIAACKRTVPLPPYGLRADRACARFGVMQAWRCILACWPLMLLMAAMPHPHPLLPMLALTAIILIEERAPNRDRLIIPIACLFAAATVAVALAGVIVR